MSDETLRVLTVIRDFYNGSLLNEQEKVTALNDAIKAHSLLWRVVHDDIAGSCVESDTLAEIQTFLDPVQFPPAKKAETTWYPRYRFPLWILERRLWSNAFGSAYQWHRYRNGLLRRFWTQSQAQQRADALNKDRSCTS